MTDALPEGLTAGDDTLVRCWWAGRSADYVAYHDDEWGRPVADDVRLYEKLCLEGFQAGLSWLTILRKREAFRAAFCGFEPEKVAAFGPDDVARLMEDAAIVRNRAKIEAAVNNAQRLLELQADVGSLAAFVWSYEPPPDERPTTMDWAALSQLAQTDRSKALSKELKRRGWRFVGPTTVYAFMQAMGVVNDHVEGCHARPAVEAARAAFARPTT